MTDSALSYGVSELPTVRKQAMMVNNDISSILLGISTFGVSQVFGDLAATIVCSLPPLRAPVRVRRVSCNSRVIVIQGKITSPCLRVPLHEHVPTETREGHWLKSREGLMQIEQTKLPSLADGEYSS